MKKLVLGLILLIGFSAYGMAQNYTEVVYLKNGSIIRGTIIEQIPNESLKIETADGNLFVFQLSEIEKTTKEENRTMLDTYKARREARKTLKGYKGFIETGYTFGLINDYYSFDNSNNFEILTSHGYQINNFFFVGGGIGLNYYTDAECYAVPIFANFRANFINKKVTPYGDVKIGYSAGDFEGAYMAFGVGVRFAITKRSALNLRLDYTLQGFERKYSYNYGYGYSYSSGYEEDVMVGFGFKLGVEF